MIKTKLSGRRARTEGIFCNYQHRICMQDRLDGSEYCFNHILEDKNSAYKQCQFISSKNGRRCINPAPKADKKDGYCIEHARKARLIRQKAALKPKPPSSTKELFEDLDYYRTDSSKLTPETPASAASKILEYGSESDSDDEPLLVEQTWKGSNDSDAESVDSEQEDLLKHAGVYTAEEVALITMDKLIRLQSLYINQFKRLQHLMKEKRRKYLKSLMQERDTIGTDLGKITNPHEKVKFSKLQAMRSYRRRRGKEALLQRKSKQRRIKSTPEYIGPQQTRIELQCSYVQDGKQCEKPTLPIARFCASHILADPLQVLFNACNKGQGVCNRPASVLSEESCCLLHGTLPLRQVRLMHQQDEESAASSAMTDHDYGQQRVTPGGSDENSRAGPSGDNDPMSSSTSIAGIASELASSLAAQLAASSQSSSSQTSTPTPSMSAGGDCKEGQQLEQQMLQLQQQIQQQIQEQQLHLATDQQKLIQIQQPVQDLVLGPGAPKKMGLQAERKTIEEKPPSTPEFMVLQKPKGHFPIIKLHPQTKTAPSENTQPSISSPSDEVMEIDPTSYLPTSPFLPYATSPQTTTS